MTAPRWLSFRFLGSVAFAALGLASSAGAQSMNVSIVNGTPSASFGAGAGQTGVWNVAPVKSTLLPFALKDLTGAATSVLFNTSTPGSDLFLNDPATSGDDQALMDGGHNIGPFGVSQIQLTGLANGKYDVFTYAWTPVHPFAIVTVGVPGSPDPLQPVGGAWNGTYTLGLTHAKHSVQVTSGQILIDVTTTDAIAMVNGVQLVQTANNAWVDLGNALPGTGGAPMLAGTGDLTVGTPVGVSLSNALPNGLVSFVVGGSNLSAPLFGGILVPNPDLILPPLPIGANGTLVLSSTMPAGVPPGIPVLVQGWIPDPMGPQGWAASNAIMALTP